MQNHDTIVYVNGKLVKKSRAVISVYDSGFCHGDGVYEGIRVYQNRAFKLEEHIRRLYEAAKTIDLNVGITQGEMKKIVLKTLRANSLRDNLHIRLMVTRGRKRVTGMATRFNVGGPSIVVLVDFKPPIFNKKGIILITSTLRRIPPAFLDSKIHHMNQLNQVMASIEAHRLGGDEAIMLDQLGFVAETNGTTLFMVKDGILSTPTANYIIVGITRGLIMEAAKKKGIPVVERDLSLYDFYNANEVFTCGTVGEIVPVKEIDGKRIGNRVPGAITRFLMKEYHEIISKQGTPID
jgi:branched-chain amino acid aminotransferase group I